MRSIEGRLLSYLSLNFALDIKHLNLYAMLKDVLFIDKEGLVTLIRDLEIVFDLDSIAQKEIDNLIHVMSLIKLVKKKYRGEVYD